VEIRTGVMLEMMKRENEVMKLRQSVVVT